MRCRDLLWQICNALDVRILKGVVSKDHIYLYVSYPPSLELSELMRRSKRPSAKFLFARVSGVEASVLGRAFLGHRLRGVGNITDELLEVYLNHHKDQPNGDENFILE